VQLWHMVSSDRLDITVAVVLAVGGAKNGPLLKSFWIEGAGCIKFYAVQS
jgi:hypothetical protein